MNIVEASRNGNIKIVRDLIKSRVDINKPDKEGFTALNSALFNYHFKTAKILIKSGADVNKIDNSDSCPLIIAAHKANLEIVRLLIKAGAYINQCHRYFGHTALIGVSKYKTLEFVVKELIQYPKIDINNTDNLGWTALMYASKHGNLEIIRILLQCPNINIYKKDYWGNTALMIAAYNNKNIDISNKIVNVIIEKMIKDIMLINIPLSLDVLYKIIMEY